MREKTPALIITFASTTQAMAAEMVCERERLPGRIIPVPREITAGCGLAWRAPPEEENRIPAQLTKAGIAWSEARVLWI